MTSRSRDPGNDARDVVDDAAAKHAPSVASERRVHDTSTTDDDDAIRVNADGYPAIPATPDDDAATRFGTDNDVVPRSRTADDVASGDSAADDIAKRASGYDDAAIRVRTGDAVAPRASGGDPFAIHVSTDDDVAPHANAGKDAAAFASAADDSALRANADDEIATGAGADDRLLQLLRAGDFVSGERIADELGVSRAAVGKRVAELRKRGFAIGAAPRRGYRLDGEPDALDAAVVLPRLTTAWLGRAWRHLPTIGSTNDEAAAWARAGAPAGAVVIADAQTKGRGRLGRTWHSPPGASLYFSVILRPPLPPYRVPPLTLAAGVAVAEALAAVGTSPQLKWPNDVLLDGKKVSGILTEMSSDLDRVHHVVVGIGVNLNTRDFPDDLAAIATSAALALGSPVSRADFVATLCARLEHWFDQFVTQGAPVVATAWKRHARIFGRRVRVSAGRDVLEGVAEDLDDDGALRLRLDDGRTTRVIAGEVIPLS